MDAAFDLIDSIFINHGLPEPTITSTYSDDRKPHTGNRASLHDACLAIDIRGKTLTDAQQDAVADSLRTALGPDFDVVSEHFKNPDKDHIHIEYDPK